MKKVLLLVVTLITASALYSQSPLAQGKLQLNAGLGFSGWGLPVYGGLDFGLAKDFTLGAEVSFRNYSDEFSGTKYNHSVMGFAGNANYHFNSLLDIPSNFDFYAGLNVGFYMWNSSSDYPGNHTSGLGLGAQVGGRYFFNEKFGLNLELGGGNTVSGGKFGVTIVL